VYSGGNYNPAAPSPQHDEETPLVIEFDGINYLAIVIAILINMGLGALWYSPVLFAKPWMAANGFTEESIKEAGGATKGYVVSIIVSVVVALAIASFAKAADSDTAIEGLMLGLAAGLGFVATTAGVSYLFESRPLKLYLINAGYPVVSFALMGLLIGAWQ
jgi:hypothetical protein